MELDREEALALYTVPAIYVYDTRGTLPHRYPTVEGVIQGCGVAMNAFCISQEVPITWITEALEAFGRGSSELPQYEQQLPENLRDFITNFIKENQLHEPTTESAIVRHSHLADNGAYGVVPVLANHLLALAAKCMQVKGLKCKSTWEAWSPAEATLQDGQ